MFKILDNHLDEVTDNDVGDGELGFETEADACQFALTQLPTDDFVFFIEDEAGEIVGLVYAGNVWKPANLTEIQEGEHGRTND